MMDDEELGPDVQVGVLGEPEKPPEEPAERPKMRLERVIYPFPEMPMRGRPFLEAGWGIVTSIGHDVQNQKCRICFTSGCELIFGVLMVYVPVTTKKQQPEPEQRPAPEFSGPREVVRFDGQKAVPAE